MGALWRVHILPLPVEIRSSVRSTLSVECAQWNWQTALQELTEEQDIWGIYMTKMLGPKAMWLLCT
jgi:hypothetical protein